MMALEYRSAREADAQKYVDHMNLAGGDSEFLAFEKGQFYLDAEQARQVIARIVASDNQAFFVAEHDDRIVGILILESSSFPKLRHATELRIAVAKAYWGQGVARRLMDMAMDYFHRNPHLTRLALQVSTRHERGIAVYKRYGFVEEGVKRLGMRIGDDYHDLVMMAVLKEGR